MSSKRVRFTLESEDDEKVKTMSNECDAICLCIIAPFPPLRIGPRRYARARFSYPDEFLLEEFVEKVTEEYPKKKDRPSLYLLIHSPGGTVSSSYMVARILRNTFNEIIGFIPHIAASGASALALGCNELVMGDISRLTGIDPYYEIDGETVYPLTIVRAFNTLRAIIGMKTIDEVSYPYQYLVQSITAEKYDEATHTLKMVEGYATELMQKADYTDEQIGEVINGLLYNIEAHEEVIPFDRAKEIGIKVKHFRDDDTYTKCWDTIKDWLRKYYMKPSPLHFVRYCFPEKAKKAEEKEDKKRETKRKIIKKGSSK